jgi:dolichyl-phosphate beta-glucosyltransferase
MPPAGAGPASLTIVLPAYNEAGRIGPALDELFAYLTAREEPGPDGAGALPPLITVLVVDDGSSDDTAAIVLARPEYAAATGGAPGPAADAPSGAPGSATPAARLELLRVPHGGKGAAVRAGMLAATGDVAVIADADMATPPDQLPRLLAALAGADVALGSRIQADGSDMRESQPGYRRTLGAVFHALASWWVAGPVVDTQCGFKGFTRAAAHDLFAQQRIRSIVFDVELIHLARRRGYRLAIVPIRWADRRGSRMRPSPRLALRVAWDLFRIPLLHRGVRAHAGRRAEA